MSDLRTNQRGSILIISLVLLSAWLVIMIAWSRFASLQAHVTVDQGAEERAFQASEAGIEYVLFLLNSDSGYTPDTLINFVQEIVGVSNSIFELTFSYQTTSSVVAQSRGYAINKPERCQEITADVRSYTGSLNGQEYYVKSWTHEGNIVCMTAAPSILPLPTP